MILQKAFKTLFKIIFSIFKFIWKLLFKKQNKQTKKNLLIHEAEWKKIDQELKSNSPSALKHTLVMADKSLDNILKDLTNGNTMGERLISGKDLFTESTYKDVWSAHKIRNSMVHETGFEPTVEVLKKSINQLRKGVKELGVKA